MRWSILICTLSWRERKFLALLDSLLPQAEEFPGQVEVAALRNNGELLLCDYRQAMLNDPRNGEYVSCVDDDDLVAHYYVAEVMSALADSPDVVGFTALVTGCGSVNRSFFSLENSEGLHGNSFYHRLSSWSPIRASLARKGSYIARGQYDDEAYAESLRPYLGHATEAFAERPLLTYTGAHLDSCQWGGPGVPIGMLYSEQGPEEKPVITSPCFRWYDGEVRPGQKLPDVRRPVILPPEEVTS